MRWEGRRESDNVEDRRSLGGKGIAMGGIGGTIIIVVIALLLGKDPLQMLQQAGVNPLQQGEVQKPDPSEEKIYRFTKVILADTEDVWNAQFRRMGKEYREPKLVVFRQSVSSACGLASSAVGPFYCPGDEKVYIDLSFFRELEEKFKAPGDFAQAYVIAHEVGHHVQNLLGTSGKVDAMRGRVSEKELNKLSVRLELQADFYAGVWAYHTQKAKNVIESGDLDEALKAAFVIGDDTLQRQSRGTVVPDSFTHGTSAQRIKWFRKGYETGDLSKGDTFSLSDNEL